jgi:transcriptional regulator with XRE-family HTH domain
MVMLKCKHYLYFFSYEIFMAGKKNELDPARGKRIKALRKAQEMTKPALGELLGLSYQSIGNWEEKGEAPGVDNLIKLSNIFNVSIDYILKGKSNTYEPEGKQRPEAEEPKALPVVPNVVVETVDNTGDPNIVFVDVPAYGGYVRRSTDVSYLKELPTFSLPFPALRHRTLRMFRIKGDSMAPVFNEGGTTVAQWVEDWPRNIKDGYAYVVITHDDILIKEVYNRIEDRGALRLKSYNSEYRDQEVQASEIKELWQCYMVLNFDLSNPNAGLMDRLYRIENEFYDLRKEVALLKSGK